MAIPTEHPLFDTPGPSSSQQSVTYATARLYDNSYVVLARALGDGTTLELDVVPTSARGASDDFPSTSSSSPHTSRLYEFPAPILPDVALFRESSALYVVLVTITGWLYRLRFPLPGGFHPTNLPHDWALERRITSLADHEPRNLGAKAPTLVHAADPGIVLVACKDGSVIKLEQRRRGGAYAGESCSPQVALTWESTANSHLSLSSCSQDHGRKRRCDPRPFSRP